jgi:hypothetical protein
MHAFQVVRSWLTAFLKPPITEGSRRPTGFFKSVFDAYQRQHPDETAQARLDAIESQ